MMKIKDGDILEVTGKLKHFYKFNNLRTKKDIVLPSSKLLSVGEQFKVELFNKGHEIWLTNKENEILGVYLFPNY